MDTDASTADSRVVEPDIKHDCDILILEYVVWDALSSVFARAQSRVTRKPQHEGQYDLSGSNDASVHKVTEKLRMVDCTYLLIAHRASPDLIKHSSLSQSMPHIRSRVLRVTAD